MAKIVSATKNIVTKKNRFGELIRFGMVGGLATGIQYGLYVVFADAVGLTATVSTIISYAISFIFNFILSNYFTFGTKPNAIGGIGFALSHLINMGMQVGLVAVFNIFMSKTLALLPAMGICIPINFILVRYALTNKRFNKSANKNTDKVENKVSNKKNSGTNNSQPQQHLGEHKSFCLSVGMELHKTTTTPVREPETIDQK